MDLGSALMAVAISLVFKLMVLGLGARLLLRMYRAQRPEQPSRMWIMLPDEPTPEVRILWWSLVLFYVSELTCGIEIYVLFQSNAYLEGVHGVCSALGMGLFALGAYLVFDKRMLRFTSRRCALRGVCRGCTVEDEEGCRFNHLLVLVATFVALAALFPLRVSTEQLNADPSVYILPFESLNAWWDATLVPWLQANIASYSPSGTAYFIPHSVLTLEFVALPLVAFAVSVAAIFRLRRRELKQGTKLLVFAAGVLCYCYFELLIYKTTADIIFGSLVHELAELWFLLAAAELLRVTFRPPAASADATSE